MFWRYQAAIAAVLVLAPAASAQENQADLAKKLANPIASLISIPFQSNIDCCYGPNDVTRYTLNIQPVIPISLSPRWNLISRTIVPIVSQDAPAPGARDTFGFSDPVQSFFFSPSEPVNGVTWGIGPVAMLPFGTDNLSQHSWAVGPTGVVLKQAGPHTVGVLANHLWSVGGHGRDISQTFVQPFYSYTYPSSTSISVSSEASYDWKAEEWNVPVNVGVARVFKFGQQRLQLGVFGRYFVARPDGAADWGVRLNVVLLYPKS